MDEVQKMISSAKNAMIHVMNLINEDQVLVITDNTTQDVGEAFYNAAIEFGCSAQTHFLSEKMRPMTEIPLELKQLILNHSIVINAFRGIAEETPFRAKLVKLITDTRSIRLGHGPSITKSMLIHGPMNIDYKKMIKNANRIMKYFNNTKQLHVKAPGGTDIILNIENRGFSTDVKITKEPLFANLPCGEIWCGPVETDANGIIICDGSIGDIGRVKKPLKITVKNGKITNFECEDNDLLKRIEELTSLDEEARVIGEFGIGLNPGAKLSGILLEDEKALNTAHIAFGNNEQMSGGKNRSITHRDFLFYNPAISVTYKNGSAKQLINNENFIF
ncbi:MAG: aminopeptidase [Promethearchaeota archaeon]